MANLPTYKPSSRNDEPAQILNPILVIMNNQRVHAEHVSLLFTASLMTVSARIDKTTYRQTMTMLRKSLSPDIFCFTVQCAALIHFTE